MDKNDNKLTSWTKFLNAFANLSSKLIWAAVGVIILAGIGKYLIFSSNEFKTKFIDSKKVQRSETYVPQTVPWNEVDAQIVEAFKKSSKIAETHADKELSVWNTELIKRIDTDFLPWYFSYWQQQWMGLKGLSYWCCQSLYFTKYRHFSV